jgi:hypothetical protein
MWKKNEQIRNYVFDDGNGKVYLSYQENNFFREMGLPTTGLDSENPETAIVLMNDKSNGESRFLIYRGDYRDELQKIYPNIEKLKEHWKEHGGHFWSDNLDD